MADRSCPPAPQPAPDPDPHRTAHHQGPRPAAGGRPASPHLLGLVPSTVHRVLARYRLARLAAPGPRHRPASIRRYERDRPGELVHVDIKKLGNIPDGGGHKVHGRAAARNSTRSAPIATTAPAHAHLGYGYLHTAVDDHSRLAYSEILADERRTPPPPSGPAPRPSSPRTASPSNAS